MFAGRDRRDGGKYVVDVAFTDRWGTAGAGPRASLDLGGGEGAGTDQAASWALLRRAVGVESVAAMRQVHGADVVHVTGPVPTPPTCDALVTTAVGLALCVRIADCVPVVLADATAGVVAVAHAGWRGVAANVVAATVETMRAHGASRIEAWVGPHICGGCYEVPATTRVEVAVVVPAAYSCTTWGTPSLDLGAGVTAQLVAAGCIPVEHPAPCTREDENLFSYRRQGAQAGRLAGLVVLRDSDGAVPTR